MHTGRTQQTSIGFLITRDTSSVRHEKTRAQQTAEVIRDPYAPLKKLPPASPEAYRAGLLSAPQALHADIAAMQSALSALIADSADGRQRPAQDRTAAAAVDAGRTRARLHKSPPAPPAPTPSAAPPNRLSKRPPPAIAQRLQAQAMRTADGELAADAPAPPATAQRQANKLRKQAPPALSTEVPDHPDWPRAAPIIDRTDARFRRSALSTARRGLAELLSIPDKGNVKANRYAAVRLHAPPEPNKLRKAPPFPVEQTREAYAAMPTYLALLTHATRRRKTALLRQQTDELIAELEDARRRADEAGRTGQLRRTAMAREIAAGRTTAQAELLRASRHCERLPDKIAALQKTLEIAQARLDAGAALARKSEARQPAARERRQLAEIERLQRRLDQAQQALAQARLEREVAGHLQAERVAGPMIDELRGFARALEDFAADDELRRADIDAQLTLQHEQQIFASLDSLKGLEHRADKDAIRAFILASLGDSLETPTDIEHHAIPAPLLVDIFIGAMARVCDAAAPLDEALRERVFRCIAARDGGVLAYEQMRGAAIADKQRRVAHRVASMAGERLEELEAAPGNGKTPGRQALALARRAAARVAAGGDGAALVLPERACMAAVRNGFLRHEDGGGRHADPQLLQVNARLEKLLTEWLTRPAARHAANVAFNKTPFSAAALDRGNKTSTLGYDDPARPMARLDGNIARTLKRLRRIAPPPLLETIVEETEAMPAAALAGALKSGAAPHLALAPYSLEQEQLLMLACAILADERRAGRAEERRPGDASLDPGDAGALKELLRTRLAHLAQDAVPQDEALLRRHLEAHGAQATAPATLVRLVQALVPHLHHDADEPAAQQEKDQLFKDAAVIGHMIDTDDVLSIDSPAKAFAYLLPRLYQLELRGKLKTMEGGVIGASTKALSWPLSIEPGTISLVVPLRGEIRKSEMRCAVFEMGFSTTGFELFVGSEKRRIHSVGGGAGPRLGWKSLISAGVTEDKSLTFERSDTEGVWLRLPRNGNDQRTYEEAEAMLRTLFNVDAQGRAPAQDPRLGASLESADGVPLMPFLIGQLLGNHPNLSVSAVDTYSEDSVRNERATNAALLSVAAGSHDDAARLQLLGAGERSERRSKHYRQSDASGFMQIRRSNMLNGGNAWVNAGLVSVSGLFAANPFVKNAQNYGGLLSTHRQYQESGVDTKLRFITRDGETNAVDTRVDVEDLNYDNHLARVAQQERELLELGSEQLYKDKSSRPPLHERMHGARAWLRTVLQQARQKSEGNSRHVYSISHCLTQSAAAVIDGLSCKAALERKTRRPAQADRTEQARDKVLQHPHAFKPWKVTTSERTSESRQFGLSVLGIYGKVQRTEGQRGTSSYPA